MTIISNAELEIARRRQARMNAIREPTSDVACQFDVTSRDLVRLRGVLAGRSSSDDRSEDPIPKAQTLLEETETRLCDAREACGFQRMPERISNHILEGRDRTSVPELTNEWFEAEAARATAERFVAEQECEDAILQAFLSCNDGQTNAQDFVAIIDESSLTLPDAHAAILRLFVQKCVNLGDLRSNTDEVLPGYPGSSVGIAGPDGKWWNDLSLTRRGQKRLKGLTELDLKKYGDENEDEPSESAS